ncbi:MAG: hypothetical protein FWD43_03625, partial [Coriobacteriia bacterium]|nr:hypothetical protein [Coriobacteriia bacterium]
MKKPHFLIAILTTSVLALGSILGFSLSTAHAATPPGLGDVCAIVGAGPSGEDVGYSDLADALAVMSSMAP